MFRKTLCFALMVLLSSALLAEARGPGSGNRSRGIQVVRPLLVPPLCPPINTLPSQLPGVVNPGVVDPTSGGLVQSGATVGGSTQTLRTAARPAVSGVGRTQTGGATPSLRTAVRPAAKR